MTKNAEKTFGNPRDGQTRASDFIQWVREHSLLFGILAGIGCGLLMLLLMVFDLPFADAVMGRNIGWVRFSAYTFVLFAVLAKNCRQRLSSRGYWSLFAALLLLHLVCYGWFILRVRPLGSIDYIVSAPFEFLLLYFLLDRGMMFGPNNNPER